MKVFSVVGNRPQFIKAAPTSVALRERGIEEVVLHTGQHYDPELSQVFFEELALAEPRYRLDLRTADTAQMQAAVAGPLGDERPDWVLVYGDTNSTLAGALAAVEAKIPLAHVEAGLRSGDLSMPEERNRIETDRVAQVLFCPDERSRETLNAEAVGGHAEVVGDVMADATRTFAPIARRRADVLELDSPYAVLTIHREANTQPERLRSLLEAAG
ncbi:MAG TPA: UDP-N-acetylglucosamine 2-epimerase, partial [Thermoleophilaceae bacterium]